MIINLFTFFFTVRFYVVVVEIHLTYNSVKI